MHVIDYVILGCWVSFWLYWLAAAVNAKSASSSRVGRFAGDRVALILIALLLFRSGALKGDSGTVGNPLLQGLGLAVLLAGLALAVWARVCLGKNWGTPMSEKVDPELVTSGPYRIIRNPIYSGIILASIGTTIAVSIYWALAVVLVGAYFVYSSLVEEKNMERAFPATYPPYKKSTWRLVPFIF